MEQENCGRSTRLSQRPSGAGPEGGIATSLSGMLPEDRGCAGNAAPLVEALWGFTSAVTKCVSEDEVFGRKRMLLTL